MGGGLMIHSLLHFARLFPPPPSSLFSFFSWSSFPLRTARLRSSRFFFNCKRRLDTHSPTGVHNSSRTGSEEPRPVAKHIRLLLCLFLSLTAIPAQDKASRIQTASSHVTLLLARETIRDGQTREQHYARRRRRNEILGKSYQEAKRWSFCGPPSIFVCKT